MVIYAIYLGGSNVAFYKTTQGRWAAQRKGPCDISSTEDEVLGSGGFEKQSRGLNPRD